MIQLIHVTSLYKLLQDMSCVSERIMPLNSYNRHDKLDFILQSLTTISKSSIRTFNAFFTRINGKIPVIGNIGFDDLRMRGLDSKLSELVVTLASTYELFSSFIDFNFGIHKKLQGISQEYKQMEEEVILLREILSRFKPDTLTGPLHVTVKRELKLKIDVIYLSKNERVKMQKSKLTLST